MIKALMRALYANSKHGAGKGHPCPIPSYLEPACLGTLVRSQQATCDIISSNLSVAQAHRRRWAQWFRSHSVGSASQGPAAPGLDTGCATNTAQAPPLLCLSLVRRGLMRTLRLLPALLPLPAAGTGAGCESAPGCGQLGRHPDLGLDMLHLIVLLMVMVMVVWSVVMPKLS